MTNSPNDLDPRLALLEALVREKVRAATSVEERTKLMELLPFLASVHDLPRLRDALKDMQRKLDEATSSPLEYAVFLGLCPPRTGQEEGDEVWQMLAGLLNDAISREMNTDARRKIQDLHDFLKEILITGRDVIVGHHGQRMEVRLAYSDVLPNQLYEGQQLVLNKHRNVVGLREEFMRGETAEVANVLSPAGTARVVGLPEDEFGPLRVQWPDGDKFEVRCPPDLLRTLHRGDVVSIDPDGTKALARVRPRLHIRVGSSETVVEISDTLFQAGVEVGDIVRVDSRLGHAFEKLPAHETGSLTLEEVPDVMYDDIGGLDEQIGQIQDAIELPYIYRSLFDLYQLPRPKGILLFGPPGCGKTLIAKAVANNLTHGIRDHLGRVAELIQIYLRVQDGDESAAADYRVWKSRGPGTLAGQNGHEGSALDAIVNDLRLNDVEPDEARGKLRSIQDVLRRQDGIRSYFLNVKGPELLTKWVGETEHRIRKIFEEAKRQASFYTPVVIFFDEMEAMFRTRGSGRSSDVETTIVPQFLSEMDGVEVSENVIIIGASNRADLIDPAIMRPGRLDIKIRIYRPDHEAAMQIMSLYLTPDLPLDMNGLKRAPESYGRNLTFKPAAIKRTAKIVAPEQAEAIGELLLPKSDIRHTWEQSESLRDLCAQNPDMQAAVEKIAEREQVTEAIIVETMNLLFSPTSRLETTLRGQGNNPDERLVFALRDFVSGAMLMSIVSRAKKRALKRRIPPIQSDQVGIDVNDLRAALHDEFNENAEQFVANWMQENVGAPRQGDIRGVKVYLEAVDEDPWGMEKARPYHHERRVGVGG